MVTTLFELMAVYLRKIRKCQKAIRDFIAVKHARHKALMSLWNRRSSNPQEALERSISIKPDLYSQSIVHIRKYYLVQAADYMIKQKEYKMKSSISPASRKPPVFRLYSDNFALNHFISGLSCRRNSLSRTENAEKYSAAKLNNK